MNESFQIRSASLHDLTTIKQILENAHLGSNDVEEHIQHFLVAENTNSITGVIGLELYGQIGLLRSAVVLPEFQKIGIGGRLVQALERYALDHHIHTLVLLTTTADGYFQRKGFTRIDRSDLQGEILTSKQLTGACPASAVIMRKVLQ